MSPPAQENWVRAEFDKLGAKIDRLTEMVSQQNTRIAVLETKEQGAIGGLRWIGALIAGGVGSAITLIGTWIQKQ